MDLRLPSPAGVPWQKPRERSMRPDNCPPISTVKLCYNWRLDFKSDAPDTFNKAVVQPLTIDPTGSSGCSLAW